MSSSPPQSPRKLVQPSTPPLSPRRDTNFVSPSPLRIRRDRSEDGVGGKASGDYHQHMDKENNPPAEVIAVKRFNDKVYNSTAKATAIKKSNDKEDNHSAEATTIEKSNDKQQAAASTPVLEKDLKASMLAMSIDDIGGNAIAADVDTSSSLNKPSEVPTVANTKQQTTQPGSDMPGVSGVSTKYISPSDALMSPCTQKLSALKGKKIARAIGGQPGHVLGKTIEDSGVRRLFGGRILEMQQRERERQEREEAQKAESKENDGDHDEGENESEEQR